jgi:septal ring factor EnvC (AmiA/AmiB activator)
VTLGKRKINPMMDRGTTQNRMGSTLSKRRSDFPLAMQHDSALNASDCGGPVVDLSGKIVGINIARDGRVSSLALPNEIVLPVLAKLKSGKMLPSIVNKKEIASAEKELAQLEKDLEKLPEEKMEKELEFSASTAVEDEIQRQIDEAEKQLAQLKERLKKKKDLNIDLGKNLARLKSKQSRLKREIRPLKSKLKWLKTGVE